VSRGILTPVAAMKPPSKQNRRGVLLLVVLSMLTLFLMLGAAYLLSASRAREAAKAYARLTFGSDEAKIPAAALLDSVLLNVVRGPMVVIASGSATTFESLLADKYGGPTTSGTPTLSGTMFGLSRVGAQPVFTGTLLTGTSTPLRPTDLVGRVLTLGGPGRTATSHRIVRVLNSGSTNQSSGTTATGTFQITLDIPWGLPTFSLASGTSSVIVNGREFASGTAPPTFENENWDGFDEHNLFLAHLRSGTLISQAEVVRGSFLRPASAANTFTLPFGTYTLSSTASGTLITGTTDFESDLIVDAADNDGDGVIDGIFQDVGLPDATDASGNVVQLRASILVVNLDGRFNVNAHDGLMKTIYTGTVFDAGWGTNPNWTSTVQSGSIPLGSGYGSAEVNAAHMFITAINPSGTFPNTEQPRFFPIAGGLASRSEGLRSFSSRYSQSQPTPRLGSMEGRYGEAPPSQWTNLSESNTRISTMRTGTDFARPGMPESNDTVSQLVDRRANASEPVTVNYGIPSVWWTGTSNFDWGYTAGVYPLPRGVFNSPPDLHGRMKTLTLSASNSALVPSVAFAQPEWSSGTAVGSQNEARDDPYELLLDTRTGRGGMLFDPTTAGSGTSRSSLARDNPFTPAELESVLRPYDIDTNKLSPRLAAMLGSAAEESRLKITTDSWDTTAITGSAALVLFGTQGGSTGWLQQTAFDSLAIGGLTPLSGVIGGEVARGERFDLNRALAASGTANAGYDAGNVYYRQRQAYFKDLYTLLFALDRGSGSATPAAQIAQWVANAIEFRDADSIMTPFEFDIEPSNGWTVDGNVQTETGEADRAVVFGVERPEILIQETLAWERVDPGTSGTTGGMCIALHRPWNAIATGTGTVQIAGEPCDYALDTLESGTGGRPLNQVDLGKKPHAEIMSSSNSLYDSGSNSLYPIWRLRIVSNGGTQYVRFDTDTAGTGELIITGTPGSAKPKLPVDVSYTFFSGTTGTVGTTPFSFSLTGSSRVAATPSEFRVAGGPPGPLFTQPTRSGTMFLERLANPSIVATSSHWTAAPLATSTTSGTAPQVYVVVDSATMTIQNTGTQITQTGTLTSTRRLLASSTTAPWRTSGTTATVSGTFPTLTSSTTTAWMPWPNRPFVSSAELPLVPRGHALGMLQNYTQLTPSTPTGTAAGASGIPISPQLLFDALHVPTRFAGIHQTYDMDLSGTTGIFSTGSNAITTVNQLSSFREPGRVNLNTVPSDDVWNAVVAGPLPSAVVSRTASTITTTGPAQTMYATLSLASGTGSTIVSDTTSAQLAVNLNPLHGIYTATRLANTTTPRSNVFGVWITLRQSIPNDPDSVRYHRAFYIVDRSIPVGFEEGKDHNVWDCVRLRRIIE